MEYFRMRRALLLVVQIVYSSRVSIDGCEHLQYLELFQPGIIQCSFQEEFLGIQWYNSTEDGTEPIVTFVQFQKGGQGYLSGEYDICLNGSLIINNVTLQHERVFSVTRAAAEGISVEGYAIRVETIVKSPIPYPVIDQCQDYTTLCFTILTDLSTLNCFVTNVRPQVSLIWSQRNADRDTPFRSQQTIVPYTEGTFTSSSTLMIPRNSPLLSVFVCIVDENEWLLEENETLIIFENAELKLSSQPIKYYFEHHSTMILPCIDYKAGILVWKRLSDVNNKTEDIIIRVNTWKNDVTKIYNKDFKMDPDGSLLLKQIEWHHEGRYTCLASDYDTEHICSFDVVILVNPNPPYLMVEGCDHQQYCVLEVEKEGNVTCSVHGIRPEVELQWIPHYPDTALSLTGHQSKSMEKGNSYDISLTTYFKFTSPVKERITLECLTVGQNSDVFQFSTKIDLLPTYEPPPSPSTVRGVIIVIAAAVLPIPMMLFIVYKVTKNIRNRKRAVEEGVQEEEMSPMMLPVVDMTKTFIRELQSKYAELYDAVQPIPYIKDRMYCVDKIYVEGGIELLEKEKDREGRDWRLLKSYHEIINKRENAGRQIIEGDPGYGKSTLTLQLAYDWCNTVRNSPLQNVNILIFLRLRQLKGVRSIYQAIRRFLLPRDSSISEDVVKSIIDKCPSVLILLDGYDEYPDQDDQETHISLMLKRKMFHNLHVILTTRSFYLPRNFATKTDRLRLTGFNEDARDQYIRKAVVGDNNEEAAKDIKLKLEQNPVLGDLCEVPLFFVMFAHMTHESKDLLTFKSVTGFFRYMISCFHSHMRNKMNDENVRSFELETEHSELNKVAFEALSGDNQNIVWDSDNLRERLGEEFYDQYIRIGILVEEEVLFEMPEASLHLQYKNNVRFYHKLFCEWYAAHYITSCLSSEYGESSTASTGSSNHVELFKNLDPFDLQYVYRFACGLNKIASDKIVKYLQTTVDKIHFAILCILEQEEKTEQMAETIKEMVSKPVAMNKDDSKLLQRSTLQILDFASKKEMPVSCLRLNKSLNKFEKGTILLHSGLSLIHLLTVEKIHIDTEENTNEPRNLTEDEVVKIFQYGLHSTMLKELSFDGCLLPTSFSLDSIPVEMKSNKIKVLWRRYGYRLNLKSGHWEVDDVDTIRKLCSENVDIFGRHSKLLQRCTIHLLESASKYNIPITYLRIYQSFSKIYDGNVVLKSGLHLSCPSSVEKVVIHTVNEQRKMTEIEVCDLLMFVQQSQMLKELELYNCLLPQTIPSKFIPAVLKSQNVTVSWIPNLSSQWYNLSLESSQWMNKNTNQKITDAEYASVVKEFRNI